MAEHQVAQLQQPDSWQHLQQAPYLQSWSSRFSRISSRSKWSIRSWHSCRSRLQQHRPERFSWRRQQPQTGAAGIICRSITWKCRRLPAAEVGSKWSISFVVQLLQLRQRSSWPRITQQLEHSCSSSRRRNFRQLEDSRSIFSRSVICSSGAAASAASSARSKWSIRSGTAGGAAGAASAGGASPGGGARLQLEEPHDLQEHHLQQLEAAGSSRPEVEEQVEHQFEVQLCSCFQAATVAGASPAAAARHWSSSRRAIQQPGAAGSIFSRSVIWSSLQQPLQPHLQQSKWSISSGTAEQPVRSIGAEMFSWRSSSCSCS